jgi:hypothetical protein
MWMRSSPVWMRSSRMWMRSSRVWMRSRQMWMRSSRGWMRSCRVDRASDCKCRSRNNHGFDPSIHTMELRGSRWSSVEYSTYKKIFLKIPLFILTSAFPPLWPLLYLPTGTLVNSVWLIEPKNLQKKIHPEAISNIVRTCKTDQLGIRTYFFRIRFRGSVILNDKSGSANQKRIRLDPDGPYREQVHYS